MGGARPTGAVSHESARLRRVVGTAHRSCGLQLSILKTVLAESITFAETVPMKASEFLKRHEKEKSTDQEDHSLQSQARERTKHPADIHAGTAFDWEDMDRYQKELDRLEREGPGAPKGADKKQH